jgi:penicillin-binding protein 1A
MTYTQFTHYFTICFVLLVCGTAFFCGAIFFISQNHTVDFSRLAEYHKGTPSIVFDDEGNEITRFQLDRRMPIPLEIIPEHVINAFLAAEDWYFFDHHGLSWRGIARSLLVNMVKGRKAQGASTITQQLVRLLFFDNAKTYTRKVKEQLCTLLVEMQFTKEYILETYLNNIYFGAGIYGIEAAAQRFWGKSITEVTLAEAATLAGIICAPNRYCPLIYPLSAQRRRDAVLAAMVLRGAITQEAYTESQKKPVSTVNIHEKKYAAHCIEYLRTVLEELVGKHTLYTKGLTIYTTLNLSMQKQAEDAFYKHVNALRDAKKMPLDGALVTLAVHDNAIKAYVGGYDFSASQFDRMQHSQRQLGSIFKLILYAAALKLGKEFSDVAVDEPITINHGTQQWSPRNYSRDFKGPMTLAYALSHSNNIVAVKTLLEIGIAPVVALAEKTHLDATIPPYPSLALGCVDTSLLNATAFFGIFAAQGMYHKPYLLTKIKDNFGNIIWKHTAEPAEQIIDSTIAGKVSRVLQHSMRRYLKYTDSPLAALEMIAKTGTTNDSRTCWFMGASPTYTTGVYIGCDDNRPLGTNVFPIHTAFPIWRTCMEQWHHRVEKFVYNPLLQELCINAKTGSMCAEGSAGSMHIFV